MPLTVPKFPEPLTQCSVSISSVTADVNFFFTLRQDQVDTWSDEDLQSKFDLFKEALRVVAG